MKPAIPVNPTTIRIVLPSGIPFMPSKIYSLIDSARDYSNSARGRGSSQNGAIVNDGGMWCASAASSAGLMYSVARYGPSTSSYKARAALRIRETP